MENNINTNEINETTTNVLEAIENAVDGMEELEATTDNVYSREHEKLSIRSLLKRWKEKRLQIPLCQRLYVWNESQRLGLMRTIKKNTSMGLIQLDKDSDTGVCYLMDGLQRLTSLMILSNDKENLTEDERKLVLDYKILVEYTNDMLIPDIQEHFISINSGVAVAAVVKDRAKMSASLNELLLSISGSDFFRAIEFGATSRKGHHNDLIAMNAMLASAKIDQPELRSRKLCPVLTTYEDDVLSNAEGAKAIVDRIARIYNNENLIKGEKSPETRSLNANFLSALSYVIAYHPEFSDDNYVQTINYIFAKGKTVKEYSNKGTEQASCKKRYETIVQIIQNPVAKTFDKDEYNEFITEHKGGVVRDTSNKYTVDFSEFNDDDIKGLYMSHRDGKASVWNTIVKRQYEALEESAS